MDVLIREDLHYPVVYIHDYCWDIYASWIDTSILPFLHISVSIMKLCKTLLVKIIPGQ